MLAHTYKVQEKITDHFLVQHCLYGAPTQVGFLSQVGLEIPCYTQYSRLFQVGY